jgi:hypothetical protein
VPTYAPVHRAGSTATRRVRVGYGISVPRTRTALLLLLAAALLAAPSAASAQPRLSWARCYGVSCVAKFTVAPNGRVKLGGRRLKRGMRVVFRARTPSGKRKVKTRWVSSKRLIARVPKEAKSGRVYVIAHHGVRSNKVGPLTVRKRKPITTPPPASGPPTGTAFDGDAMWIWYVSKASGGSASAIAAQARAHGVETVFVKSGDGRNYWSQFSSGLVQALRARGLHVCAWQYVYGSYPSSEASVAAKAVRAGAECFVIDAETEYEGRYSQARTYISALRNAVGASYPIGMSSFPYVDYHPGLPYSTFFAPGGAQFDVPQVYWKAIGDSVDTATNHTYRYNRPYGVPIVPVGQTYDAPPKSQLVRFRQVARAQGSAGLSWWSWQHTSAGGWNAVGQELGPFSGPSPATDLVTLAKGAKGDLVVWAQQHLRAAGQSVKADGVFGTGTRSAVLAFQGSKALPQTGQVDTATWRSLLAYAPPSVARRGNAKAAATERPKTADLPAKRYEIPPPSRRR